MSSTLTSPRPRKRTDGPGGAVVGSLHPAGSLGKGGSGFDWSKLFSRDQDWDRDELGDVLHWMRQILGLLCGLVWGLVPLTGGIWFLVFIGLSTGLAFVYYSLLLAVDEEDFGGHGSLLQEGMMSSVGLFMLTWTLTYSLAHFD